MGQMSKYCSAVLKEEACCAKEKIIIILTTRHIDVTLEGFVVECDICSHVSFTNKLRVDCNSIYNSLYINGTVHTWFTVVRDID